MLKRRYTKIKEFEPVILTMREAGYTRREIADELGIEVKQIEWWVSRYNKSQELVLKGKEPKAKGRPRKDGQPPRQDLQKEVERLRMENKLLRDFLQLTERK
jgi:transposase